MPEEVRPLDEARKYVITRPVPDYPFLFVGPDGTWVLRLTAGMRFEVNPAVSTDDAATAVFDAVNTLLLRRAESAAEVSRMREALAPLMETLRIVMLPAAQRVHGDDDYYPAISLKYGQWRALAQAWAALASLQHQEEQR